MTKHEFLSKIPDIITHEAHGYGELEIVVDAPDKKGVCYRHKDNTASFGTYASSYSELFEKFSKSLISCGYIKPTN